MSILEFIDISKCFGDVTVLDNVNFKVSAGEIFGFLGLNGAGKTTLIKIILDLLQADSGFVKIDGRYATEHESRSCLSYLPEKFLPNGNLTGMEFLKIFIDKKYLNIKKIGELCASLSLSADTLDKKIKNLSKGTAQKLGLLYMVLEDKKLFVMDEPMSGLDPKTRNELKNLLLSCKNDGNAIFFSSHMLSDVDDICDEIAVLDSGKIKFIGSPKNLKEQYEETSLERAFIRCIDSK
ncbi:ABC transporter ATP-binding protein [Bacilli bacterium]|nr:ABC transporter ATP-binding protein [Bacilli bacterium]